MRKKFIKLFICPICKSPFNYNEFASGIEEISTGKLVCRSGHGFGIDSGIPDFIINDLDGLGDDIQKEDSVKSFGFEWQWDSSPRTEEDLDYRIFEKPRIDEKYLKGKIILDAGCGAGMQTKHMARHADIVIGADLSEAVKVAYKNNISADNACIIKADISHLPFADGAFDYIYCEGVLQHTKNPVRSFYALVGLLKKGGSIFATFYSRRETNITPFLLLRQPIRFVLSRLPEKICWYICWLSVPLNKIPLLKHFFRKTIVLYDKRNPGDKSTWCINYDFYGPHKYQYYFKPSEITKIWNSAGEKLIVEHAERGYPLRGTKV